MTSAPLDTAPALSVMSFNIRCRWDDTFPGEVDHWGDRRPGVQQILRDHHPHLVGVQEAYNEQLDALLEALPGHRSIGVGRDGGSHGEYSAILYDTARLDLVEWHQYWISEHPDTIGSTNWGAGCVRVATVGTFRDKADGTVFSHTNTHLDNASEIARVEGARMIAQRLGEHPAIVTGDFNCDAGIDEPWRVLTTAGLRDAWLASSEPGPAVDTFNDYAEPFASEPLSRIDWVMVSPEWNIGPCGVVLDRPGGRWASDHWPVVAELTLG